MVGGDFSLSAGAGAERFCPGFYAPVQNGGITQYNYKYNYKYEYNGSGSCIKFNLFKFKFELMRVQCPHLKLGSR